MSQYDLTKCSGRTPFDKAYIGNDNLYHVEINAQIASWFREEVYQQKAPSQCTTNNPNCGNGSGLTTTYYNNQDLQGSPVATFNGNIDIIGDQSGTLPNSGQLAQNVSARWEGQVEAPVSGSYTFNVRTDDGVRVWFDNQQRVDDFGYYPPRDHNFSVNLTAGQKYNVKVEWKQGSGGFEAKMFWNYPGQSNQIVPSCWLFPTSGGGGGCTAPNPPTVSASPTSISSGGYSDLSASGCSGTVKWSHDASAPSNVRVYPGGTTTYTATCEANGCTSSGASVTVTVNGGGSGGSFSQCIEAENSSGNGPVTGDPNASSGQTRGAENNYNHYVEYTVTGVPTPGNYTLTLQYYSAPSGPTVEVSVTQGGSGSQTKTMPNSGSWNIVHTTYDFTVNLGAGTNKIKIQGTGGGSCRQDKICVTGGGGGGCTPPGAPSLSATANPINAGQSTTLTASGCGGTVNWNTPGGNPTVSPASTTTYTATCTVNGCTSGNGSVTITVNGTPPSGSCSASNDQCSGNQYEVRNYTVSVPSSGSYTLRVTYRSHEGNGAIRWSVNGGGAQTKPVSQTALDPYQEVDLGSASLSAGNNTVSLSSGALYVCFRKVCANSGSARLGVAEEPATDSPELTVSPNPNDGEFVARFYVEPGRKATLRVSDIQGREVWKKNLTGQGAHSEPVRLPAQSIGSYILLLDKEATDSKGKADRRPAQFKRVIVVK